MESKERARALRSRLLSMTAMTPSPSRNQWRLEETSRLSNSMLLKRDSPIKLLLSSLVLGRRRMGARVIRREFQILVKVEISDAPREMKLRSSTKMPDFKLISKQSFLNLLNSYSTIGPKHYPRYMYKTLNPITNNTQKLKSSQVLKPSEMMISILPRLMKAREG